MADTVRNISALQTLLADNTSGAISPQDLRDVLVSLSSISGWGDYVDTANTSGSPQSISANTDTIVLNNAGTKLEQELPFDVAAAGGFYDSANNKILAVTEGDGKLITVEFSIRRASGSGEFTMETFFDIGGAVGELYNRTSNLPGSGDRHITFTTAVYTLDTWATNGATFNINTSVATEIWSVRYVIHRLHRGQGNYGA